MIQFMDSYISYKHFLLLRHFFKNCKDFLINHFIKNLGHNIAILQNELQKQMQHIIRIRNTDYSGVTVVLPTLKPPSKISFWFFLAPLHTFHIPQGQSPLVK